MSPADAAAAVWKLTDRHRANDKAAYMFRRYRWDMARVMDAAGLDVMRDVQDLMRLRQAKTTKFFAYEGKVEDERVVSDNATQLRALELTLRIRGLMSGQSAGMGDPLHQQVYNILNIQHNNPNTQSPQHVQKKRQKPTETVRPFDDEQFSEAELSDTAVELEVY